MVWKKVHEGCFLWGCKKCLMKGLSIFWYGSRNSKIKLAIVCRCVRYGVHYE